MLESVAEHDHRGQDHERVIEAYPERANLYHLRLEPAPIRLYVVHGEVNGKAREEVYFTQVAGAKVVDPTIGQVRRALQSTLLAALRRTGYGVGARFPLVVDTAMNYAPGGKSLQIHPAFNLRIMCFAGSYFICLDHQLMVRSVLSVASLTKQCNSLQLSPSQRLVVRMRGEWKEGALVEIGPDTCHVSLMTGEDVEVPTSDVVPRLTRSQVSSLAPALGISAQTLERSIKQLSFLTVADASRARLDACNEFALRLSKTVFPIPAGGTTLFLDPSPAALRPPVFAVGKDLDEVAVAFDHVDQSKRARGILGGLTSFGAYDKPSRQIGLVLVTTQDRAAMMGQLVQRLNRGALRYHGAEKTFGTQFEVRHRVICSTVDDYEDAIRQFVRSEVRDNVDIALVYLPKSGETSDHRHPYFRVKGLLVREGVASQMVDEATVRSPEWRDLNLALNIYAKAGNVPWVLDEAMDGVDLFIGLSSSQVGRGREAVRMMGYVNVFDSYGRWRFYQGDSVAFPFEERLHHLGELVKNSIAAYRAKNGPDLKSIQIHLTKQFSAQERAALAEAVHRAAPGASITFVWVNPYHHLRLYDLSPGSDGSIGRATYLLDEPGRLYLATTGRNAFGQKGMGTPVPVQLTVWSHPSGNAVSLRDVGQHILSLTRLNWGSTKDFCHEPITTKFAGDIARLMTAFMQNPSFVVNPSLRGSPWFL